MPTDEIPDDIAALLRDVRTTDVPPAGAQERVWARTMARIDGPAPGPAAGTSGAIAGKAALYGFAVGLLSGIAGTYAAVTLLAVSPDAAHVPVPTPPAGEATNAPLLAVAPALAAAATPAAPVLVRTAPAVIATPAPVTVISPAPDHSAHATERATERAWLDAAHMALSRGQLDDAMSNLETARTRFPDGTLSEEREALGVLVLIAGGDEKTAQLAIDTFRKRHKGSLFIPAIEEAMNELVSPR